MAGIGHGVIVVSAGGDVHKGQGLRLLHDFRKGDLDLHLAPRHLELVLVGVGPLQLNLVAVGVVDSELVQLIAVVRVNSDCHGIPALGTGGADADGTVIGVLHRNGVAGGAGG